MKQKKTALSAKRARAATVSRHAQTRRLARPLHKRVLLHPLSVMVLLCAGVLIIGSTLYTRAATYEVTATVPADPLTEPATITQPDDQLHVSATPITVTGSCPLLSYVKLFRNGVFSGVDVCSGSQSFQIHTVLAAGSNQLLAQDYNLTDQAGPVGTSIVVYYDPPAIPPPSPPAAPPIVLDVSTVDRSNYDPGLVPQSSTNPTVRGTAPPFSDITITFHSAVTTCLTKADNTGNWSCTLDRDLPPGLHLVEVVATTPDGTRLVFAPFQIKVVLGLASLLRPAAPNPLATSGDYLYRAWHVGQLTNFVVNVAGGSGPYRMLVDWGDGKTSDYPNAQQPFTISHTYATAGKYAVFVKVIDAKGEVTILQLSAVVKAAAGSAGGVTSGGSLPGILDSFRQWLWLVWPAYIATVLMVVSFWIGERQAYQRLLVRVRVPQDRGKMK